MFWEIVVVFRDRDIGGAAMNSVEDLDVFKLAHQLALRTDVQVLATSYRVGYIRSRHVAKS